MASTIGSKISVGIGYLLLIISVLILADTVKDIGLMVRAGGTDRVFAANRLVLILVGLVFFAIVVGLGGFLARRVIKGRVVLFACLVGIPGILLGLLATAGG